jgi:hypothetical protein
MKMRTLLLLAVVSSTTACFDNSCKLTQDQIGAPSVVPSAAPSPSPSASATPVATVECKDWHVFMASFGWDGPGGAVRPGNQDQPYPLCLACESMLTATLKTPQGDAPLSVSSASGRPEWTVSPVDVLKIDSSNEATNNADGYNLKVTPNGSAGATADVKVVLHALCKGDPPTGTFKYTLR